MNSLSETHLGVMKESMICFVAGMPARKIKISKHELRESERFANDFVLLERSKRLN